ncbi:MAG: hypothetical protein ACM65M_13325 [Microcoleus sp.]
MAAKHYHVKEALADWDVLRDIAKEVKGKGEVSNDLTRWAAASALEAIGYSRQSLENLQGGGFTEPLDRIRREIRDRKLAEINKIKRLNSRGETTAEYERHLEFWLYGPVDELLNDNSSWWGVFGELVKDVICQLHGRGVYLGLMSPNKNVQEVALGQAGLIFKESVNIENFIYRILEGFLLDSSQEMRLKIKAAEIISNASDLKKLTTLSKLLLEETQLRNTAVRLLTPYKQELARVESDAYRVLEALNFEYSLDKPEPKSLRIPEIENRISSANQLQSQITQKFASAIAAAEALASKYRRSALVVQFLQNQEFEIEDWIQKLNNQKSQTATEQDKIESNQLLLKGLKGYGLKSKKYLAQLYRCKELTTTDHRNFNYEQCKKRLSDLNSFKNEIISRLNEEEKKVSEATDWLSILMAGCLTYNLLSFIHLESLVFLLVCFWSFSFFFVIFRSIFMSIKEKEIRRIVRRLNEQWRA